MGVLLFIIIFYFVETILKNARGIILLDHNFLVLVMSKLKRKLTQLFLITDNSNIKGEMAQI